MKFLNNLIRFVIFIIWALIVFYIAKALGFTYDPDDTSIVRKIIQVVLILIIFGGGYFIRKIEFIRKKKKD